MRYFSLLLCALALTGVSHAEDLDIYGGGGAPPNVLLVIDASDTMGQTVGGAGLYDPAQTYPGKQVSLRVYESKGKSYRTFLTDLSQIDCPQVEEDLLLTGVSLGAGIVKKGKTAKCSTKPKDVRDLYLGNYINYLTTGGGGQTKLQMAKDAALVLIDALPEASIGLLATTADGGARLLVPVGTNRAALIAAVNALTAGGDTSQAELLAEAGLYFAGRDSWFDRRTTYTSPILYPCQKNHVVLFSDETAWPDDALEGRSYMGAFDPTLSDSEGNGLLDEVAVYLKETDLITTGPAAGDGELGQQSVTTHTVGFVTPQERLQGAALAGGGLYVEMGQVLTLVPSLGTSGLPYGDLSLGAPGFSSAAKGFFAGDRIYTTSFSPRAGVWAGNLKAYTLTDDGRILDQNGRAATSSDGSILDTAHSLWSDAPDGTDAISGGAGAMLARQGSRNLYTFLPGSPSLTLSDTANSFSSSNPYLTLDRLGVSTEEQKQSLIATVSGEDREWPLADIIHSTPAVQRLTSAGESRDIIYVGSNGGMLHAFDGDTGEELWGFIPSGQVHRLKLLGTGNHPYFVDGPVSLFDNELLVFGERRGGPYRYALDVSTPETPVLKYTITEAHLEILDWDLDGEEELLGGAELGQSWSAPQQAKMKVGEETHEVLVFAGGYDPNQDLATPAAVDPTGRAIFSIDQQTGEVVGLNVNGALWPEMTNSVLDVTSIDRNGDGYVNRVFAGDMGGRVLALRDDDYDGNWERHLLFSLPETYPVDARMVPLGRKFMTAPEVSPEPWGEMLYLGTGDREKPNDRLKTDAIYAVPSFWDGRSLSVYDLVDVTDNRVQDGNQEEQEEIKGQIAERKGWMMRLPNAGEKVVSTPLLFNKVLYFTTFTPGTTGTTPCEASGDLGTARLYAVDYQNAGARINFATNWTNPGGLDIHDRSIVIGHSIPTAPRLTVTKAGVSVSAATGLGVTVLSLNGESPVRQYFWRQL